MKEINIKITLFKDIIKKINFYSKVYSTNRKNEMIINLIIIYHKDLQGILFYFFRFR